MQPKVAYDIVRGADATDDDIRGVSALDRLCLEARYQVTADQDRPLFRANAEGSFIVKDPTTGTVIAYLMVLPIREDIYRTIRAGQLVDTALTKEMVLLLDRPGEYLFYFDEISVHPHHRSARLVYTLIERMFADFVALAKRGVWAKCLMADVISPAGRKVARLIGSREVCQTDHDSTIFEVTLLPPEFRPVVPSAKRFAALV